MLSNIVYTHLVIIDKDRSIPLTHSQYQTWRLAKEKYGDRLNHDPITICDGPGMPIRFDGEVHQGREFEEIKTASEYRYYFCDYGEKHIMSESCIESGKCRRKYGEACTFKEKAAEKYPNKYVKDLTPSQKLECKK